MYNAHRGMVPGAPGSRLTELLDQVRQEFENQQTRTGEYEQNCTSKISNHSFLRISFTFFQIRHVGQGIFHFKALGHSYYNITWAKVGTATNGLAMSSGKPVARDGDGEAEGIQSRANPNSDEAEVRAHLIHRPIYRLRISLRVWVIGMMMRSHAYIMNSKLEAARHLMSV